MPTLVRGSYSTRSGFTLVEILIVVLIIGATAGLASLAMNRSVERLEIEARRLRQIMDHAALRARLTGTPLAWQASAQGYRFLGHGDAWRELPASDADEILRPRTLPASMSVRLANTEHTGRMPGDGQAVVIFPASGLAQVFELRMSYPGEPDITIRGDAGGRISVLPDPK